MVSVVKRMRALKNLYALKFGPGGAVLPPNITRIHMEFGLSNYKGHVGPTKFWQDHLPRLKFWNPSIPMIVNRIPDNDKPATMSIYFRQSALGSSKKKAAAAAAAASAAASAAPTTDATATPAASPEAAAEAAKKQAASRSAWDGSAEAPPPVEGERVVTIDMTHLHSDAILADFMAKTGAVPVEPSPEDREEMAELATVKKQGDADRVLVRNYVQKQKREKALLERARKEADAIKAANAM